MKIEQLLSSPHLQCMALLAVKTRPYNDVLAVCFANMGTRAEQMRRSM